MSAADLLPNVSSAESSDLPRLESITYWLKLPFRWAHLMVHNGHGIARVLDIIRFRPLGPGLVGLDHPWVTGINPATGNTIWADNVIYRSPRPESGDDLPDDEVVLSATCRFLAERVRQSAVLPELPVGPKRRMPHAINYIHGVSHYNSGIIILNDLEEGYRYVTDPQFQEELRRFVREENREVLFLFRDRRYEPKEYAFLSCCMRSIFGWFCNPNGPNGNVLWGNASPFPAANLITGRWVGEVYSLKEKGGAQKVIRPAIAENAYFTAGPYDRGRDHSLWPERLLAWATHYRIRLRGGRAGMFFVDRTKVYADQIENRRGRGKTDHSQAF